MAGDDDGRVRHFVADGADVVTSGDPKSKKSRMENITGNYCIIWVDTGSTESTKVGALAGIQLLSSGSTCRAARAGGRGRVYTCRFGGGRLEWGVWRGRGGRGGLPG
jgi:hypothetical protein